VQTLALIFLVSAAISFVVYGLGIWATIRHTSQVPATVPDDRLPAISLLKPLKGFEESLEANLRTFFEQDYPAPFEIVVGAADAGDAGDRHLER
jgi:ceramide glucosyltransferase